MLELTGLAPVMRGADGILFHSYVYDNYDIQAMII